jgi:hypothetical protein
VCQHIAQFAESRQRHLQGIEAIEQVGAEAPFGNGLVEPSVRFVAETRKTSTVALAPPTCGRGIALAEEGARVGAGDRGATATSTASASPADAPAVLARAVERSSNVHLVVVARAGTTVLKQRSLPLSGSFPGLPAAPCGRNPRCRDRPCSTEATDEADQPAPDSVLASTDSL